MAPRFTPDDLAWLRECHPEGQHCPTYCADIFVTDVGVVALEPDGLYVLWAYDGEVLVTGLSLAAVMP
jgi:hypothetical protein